MIDVISKRCAFENCSTRPTYNLSTETKALFCSEHKQENMIDVKNKRCVFENCMTQPSYNLPTETKALFCSEHKQENMIDVKSKRCAFENCMTRPIYNLPTESKALFCLEHKQENMIDIKHKRCVFENCMTRPAFNLPTEKNALYCLQHKTNQMINVKNKNCQDKKCKETAIFGFINKRPQFCINHKKNNMINLILENKCSVLDCQTEYDFIHETIKYCNSHVPNIQYCTIIKKLCKYCDIREDVSYVCKDCKKIQNKKEWAIVRHLRKTINTPFVYNSSKMLQGCSKKRPDIYFELPKHCVIVEIDENQHKSYEDVCECARINEIVNGIGGKPVIIIRYNPDKVRNNGNILEIPQEAKVDLLVDMIIKELIAVYDEFLVKVIQLFYDDNYTEYKMIKEEIITDKVCI
jgi:hypothetical protein